VTRLDTLSESQANALALDKRSRTYADEHAKSWEVRFDRPSHEPTSLRGYVRELRDAYEAEVPRVHSHDIDAGGTPALTPRFEAWLDDQDSGPFRTMLRGMERGKDERTQRRARIVYHAIVGGFSAGEAAVAEGVPDWCADTVAYDALQVAWRRYASTPIAPAKKEAA
jgi:hypothetical protein